MKTRILFIGLAFIAFLATANAQSTTEDTSTKKAQTSFVDENNNGVCDNYEARATTGNGQGKAYRNGQGKGNGNGQCLCKGKGKRAGQGKGQGKGQGLRNGNGNGQGQFVDENNNGICDRKE